MYDSCNSYDRNQECAAKSLKISQLKTQLNQLEADDNAYNELLQKYRQLQNEYQLINEAKLHLEYELRQKTESTNKIINDLKCQNVDLNNELNEKNTIYQKLYADNTNLFRNLEERKKENENFCKTLEENENMINQLNQDKEQCEHEAMLLDGTSKKNQEDIENLCKKLDSLKLRNKTQNDELNSKNIEMSNNQKCLDDIKCDNAELNNQINLKISSIDTIQKQLTLANKSLVDLQNELNNLEKEHSRGKDQLENMKITFQNEHNKRMQAENDNVRLEDILKDKDDTVNKLCCMNEALKSDRDKLNMTRNKLMSDVDKYKNHIMLGLLWQIVKVVVMRNIQLKMHPELIRLLNPGEQLSDLLKLSPEQLLLRWFNYHLKAANYPKKITNFSGDVKDSEKYTVLLHQLNKNLCDNSALHDTDLRVRARKVIDNSKKLGAESYITPDDICAGNSKLNTLFVASIFNAYPGLDPPTEEEIDAAKMLDDDIEGAREERAFRMWINSLGLNDQDGNVVYINNLYEESKDGLVLLRTLEKVKPSVVNWKIVDQRPNNVFKRLINCNEVIDASKRSKYQIIGIGGTDIRDGNKKYILAIVWQMMRAHSLQIIGNQTEEGLIAWGNSLVEDQYKIKNLKDKRLGNSLYFIHIMKSIEPRAIDWDIVITDRDDEEAKTNNAKYALSIARKLGATVFLVWEDIAEVKSKLILTFLASIYDVASKYSAKY